MARARIRKRQRRNHEGGAPDDQDPGQTARELQRLAIESKRSDIENQFTEIDTQQRDKKNKIDKDAQENTGALYSAKRRELFLGRIGSILSGSGSIIEKILGAIKTVIAGVLGPVWSTISKYVGLIIGVILIIIVVALLLKGGFSRRSSGSSNRVQQQRASNGGRSTSYQNPLARLFNKIVAPVLPGANISQLLQKASLQKHRYNTYVPRKFIGAGRCDNAAWFELPDTTDPINRPGVCAKTAAPQPISWILDTDRMPELSSMPEAVRKRVTNDDQKMRVNIPWALESTFFVPKCDQATFADGSSAAYLLRDQGLSCKLGTAASKGYTAAFRPKDAKDAPVDAFATEQNPRC